MPQLPFLQRDGAPFADSDLTLWRQELAALSDAERRDYRDRNAAELATDGSARLLLLSGPGTGKSTLFKQRILHWLQRNQAARVLALTFVRKLVVDLANDVENDGSLSSEQKRRVAVHTLHRFARSVVERHGGCRTLTLGAHVRVVAPEWDAMVWEDTLLHAGCTNSEAHTLKQFADQFHNGAPLVSGDWPTIHAARRSLCSFYNALGFAETIVYATDALNEDPNLIEYDYFIIDEYQDFNRSELLLIDRLTLTSPGVLVVGDDDQVLYDGLKASKPAIIRGLYADRNFVNGMLPFCGRCGQHIVDAASAFIAASATGDRTNKIFLPLATSQASPRIRVIAFAKPSTAVRFIREFLADHATELRAKQEALAAGSTKDPFLMLLTPAGDMGFYVADGDALRALVAEYATIAKRFSDDYCRVLVYYSSAERPAANFAFRKVLWHEGVSPEDVAGAIETAVSEGRSLSDVDRQFTRGAVAKAEAVRAVLRGDESITDKVAHVATLIHISERDQLAAELAADPIGTDAEQSAERRDEEDAEREELGVRQMNAVELMTIVGSKGLSADHVMILGFDNVNFSYVGVNAFYVAMTRARQSLQLLTSLRARGAREVHHFLEHIPDDHLECSKYTNGVLQPLGTKANLVAYIAQQTSFYRR